MSIQPSPGSLGRVSPRRVSPRRKALVSAVASLVLVAAGIVSSIVPARTAAAQATPASRATPASAERPGEAASPGAVQGDTTDFAPDRVIVQWRDAGTATARERAHGLQRLEQLPGRAGAALVTTGGRSVDDVLASLRADPTVVYAEPDYTVRAEQVVGTSVTTNDPRAGDQYSLRAMQVTDAWTLVTGGSATIAVVDTGVSTVHPDLAGRVLPGYDFANNDTDARDDNGHGTVVAGIIAAIPNNGIGVAGVTWSDRILPVKVLDSRASGYVSDVGAGIIWAADRGASVINMSFGGGAYSQYVQDAVNHAWARGAVLVAAAGNGGREELFYPASYANVASVTATQREDEFTRWSSYGAKVDVSAPGADIWATDCGGCSPTSVGSPTYISVSGTSMSSPNVAGVVALMRARYPNDTNAQVVERLVQTSDDRGYPGWDNRYGYGRVNAFRAVGGSVVAPATLAGDGLEPNDGLSTARPVRFGESTPASIYPAGDTDVFALDVPGAGRVDVSVTAIVDTQRSWASSLPVDPILELLDATGGVLVRVDGTDAGATEKASVELASGGRLYVRVSNWYPNGNTRSYSLTPHYTADTVRPHVSATSPAASSANVPNLQNVWVWFSEPVSGVGTSTVVLRDAVTSAGVSAGVWYDSASRAAMLRPAAPLASGRTYEVSLSSSILDAAGNALAATSFSFTTAPGETFSSQYGIRFLPGTHTGYQFTSTGAVWTASTVSVATTSSALTSHRATISGQPGFWLYVTTGTFAGYWVPEWPYSYVPGFVGYTNFATARRVSFAAGTHSGYTFDWYGKNLTWKTLTHGEASAAANARAIINGRAYLHVIDGPYAYHWVVESSVIKLN